MTKEVRSSLVGESLRERVIGKYGISIHEYDDKMDSFVVHFIEWESGNPIFVKSDQVALEVISYDEIEKNFSLTGKK
jgi:hypothetical protein